MEFFKIRKDIPFMRYALTFNVISLVVFILAVGFLVARGLNLGVDFTGGTLIETRYVDAVALDQVRADLAKAGFGDAVVQNYGTLHDVLVRVPPRAGESNDQIVDEVLQALPGAVKQRGEFVGPQVSEELLENGGLALLFVSMGIIVYLWIRFEWKFGVAAVVANLHDVVIILGFFACFQWDFSLPVLAAVLAVLGYSVNESVVIFDRVRENFRKMRDAPVPTVINNAITRTLSRTIITHGCTQLAVLSMLLFGGETLHYFALALTIGIMFGIYSSALVSSPIVMWLGISRADLIRPVVKKEGV